MTEYVTTSAMTLDPERKAQWLAALRDPNAHQTTGVLEHPDGADAGQCCLGVACRLALASGLDFEVDQDQEVEPDETRTITRFAGESTTLPEIVSRWLWPNQDSEGDVFCDDPTVLACTVPDGGGRKVYFTAATLNDAGFTFPQIADLVEVFL